MVCQENGLSQPHNPGFKYYVIWIMIGLLSDNFLHLEDQHNKKCNSGLGVQLMGRLLCLA